MMKATNDHRVLPNLLNIQLKYDPLAKVLLTDITYLFYKNGKKAYLSTILYASINEVLAYNLSKSLQINIVIKTIDKLLESIVYLNKAAYIHSDQGSHYTSPIFQNKLKEIGQSMPRLALQESFWGHLKDEKNIKECEAFYELVKEIDDYIDYHNNYRSQ